VRLFKREYLREWSRDVTLTNGRRVRCRLTSWPVAVVFDGSNFNEGELAELKHILSGDRVIRDRKVLRDPVKA
jgi:hypothetical protein